MKKLLFMLLAMALSLTQMEAQSVTVAVGDTNSTITDYAPVGYFWNYSYSQAIYLSTELQPGMITAISYQYDGKGFFGILFTQDKALSRRGQQGSLFLILIDGFHGGGIVYDGNSYNGLQTFDISR